MFMKIFYIFVLLISHLVYCGQRASICDLDEMN